MKTYIKGILLIAVTMAVFGIVLYIKYPCHFGIGQESLIGDVNNITECLGWKK